MVKKDIVLKECKKRPVLLNCVLVCQKNTIQSNL